MTATETEGHGANLTQNSKVANFILLLIIKNRNFILLLIMKNISHKDSRFDIYYVVGTKKRLILT